MEKPQRFEITPEITEKVMSLFKKRLELAYLKHGKGACWSMHEATGMIDEEVDELKVARHENNVHDFVLESIDVMIAGFWSAASVEAGCIDGKWDKARSH